MSKATHEKEMTNLSSDQIPTGISMSFRLSAHQLTLIRPGLKLIIGAHNMSSNAILACSYCRRDLKYLGTFNSLMMAHVVSGLPHLYPTSQNGIRLRMTTFQIRACILGIRIIQDFEREKERKLRKQRNLRCPGVTEEHKTNELKRRQAAGATIRRLRTDSKRVIRSLERLVRKANRRLKNSTALDQTKLLIKSWQHHVQWMRNHLVYFRPPPPVGPKRWHRRQIDRLVPLAIEGLAIRGYLPLPPTTVRFLVRLALRYHRAERLTLHILNDKPLRFQLSFFIVERCNLRNSNL
jgi:hypothetical protein